MVLLLREPTRLVNSDSTDELTLRLLQSADVDQPATRAVSRAMVRVTSLLAGDQNVVVAARVSEVAPRNRSRSSRPDALGITRAASVGILLGTSVAAAVVGVTQLTSPAKPPVVVELVNSAPNAKVSTRRASHAAIAPQEQASEAPVPSASNSSQGRDVKPARSSNNDLGQEVALLDTAKAALSTSNPGGALRALDEASRLPRCVLVPEATVLRVRALVALNRTPEARRVVESFVARSPNSPVNPILRDLVAPIEKP